AGAALRAFVVDDVHLRGDVVADAEAGTLRALADLLDESVELVAVDARRFHRVVDRRIPVIDVLIRSAYGGGPDADEHLIRRGHWTGTVANFCSFGTVLRVGFDDCEHQA